MKTRDGQDIDITILNDGTYRINKAIKYFSPRYQKTITIPAGMISDGASGPAEDILSMSWIVHDRLCSTWQWDDGSFCGAWQSSNVIRDILLSEGRWIRANRWFVATFLWQLCRKKPDKTPRFPVALA